MIFENFFPILASSFIPTARNAYWNFFGGSKAYSLCFHDVSNSDSIYAINPSEFFSLISSIKEKIVSIDELKVSSRKDPVVLTFDDGFESMISTIAPYLASEKIPFVCYVTTCYINRDGYLSEKQLQDLSQNPFCTIGSHMCSHSKTRQMTAEQVRQEWVKSKEILQSITSNEVRHAALPYGSYLSCTEKSKRIALESGYDTIANTIATPFSRTNKEIYRYVYQKNSHRVERIIKELLK